MADGADTMRHDEPGTQHDEAEARDDEAVGRFVERFASVLIEVGMPPMPARVFTALLASDSGRLTSAELSKRLHVSPAAVSGAMRYLTQLNLASRERVPGSRRDSYRVHADVWHEALVRRDQVMVRWQAAARDGVEALGPGTPAGARVAETLAFFEFVHAEIPALLERWRARQAALRKRQGN